MTTNGDMYCLENYDISINTSTLKVANTNTILYLVLNMNESCLVVSCKGLLTLSMFNFTTPQIVWAVPALVVDHSHVTLNGCSDWLHEKRTFFFFFLIQDAKIY